MNKIAKKQSSIGDTLMTFAMGFLFVTQIRSYVKSNPGMKQSVIEALEMLVQELKNTKP